MFMCVQASKRALGEHARLEDTLHTELCNMRHTFALAYIHIVTATLYTGLSCSSHKFLLKSEAARLGLYPVQSFE